MFPVGRCEVNIAKLLPVGRAEKPFLVLPKPVDRVTVRSDSQVSGYKSPASTKPPVKQAFVCSASWDSEPTMLADSRAICGLRATLAAQTKYFDLLCSLSRLKQRLVWLEIYGQRNP